MANKILSKLFGDSSRYGNYEIIDLINEGGMSHVYRARRLTDDLVVALKVLKAETLPDPDKSDRAARSTEGEIATTLQHENVVRTYEYGGSGGTRYIVMEYVDGPNLRHVIRKGGLAHENKLDVIMQIGRGTEYIHSKGLVHRDLCPKNILLNKDGVAKIIDFGLAIVEREKIPNLWERSGTASYMAPEQIRGNQGDCRADIYAFGLTMYEILTNRRPFEGDSRLQKMQGHLNIEAPPPSQFNESISPAVEDIIMAALAKDANKRPQSMTAVLNKLSLALRQQPPQEVDAEQEDEEQDMPADSKPWRGKRWETGDIYRALDKARLSAGRYGPDVP